ncbi:MULTISPECIES: hypothetical protein [unclassified Streptomyces]|uniref:hypothetical protein n=1 Tax=unclassified Streptomyces TaxID=2593676 RepID=UPI00225B00CE|nr:MULTISPECIES: hypothetical protein [unclassified Streptomyces]MCX4409623.1 hypothetical protein [Streptomyces sp. NBC_01764]MCX5191395.1 hypothetical protein [Streptomyces sp. NBC_00268]
MGRPIDDREQVREPHAKGKSRNDIAREINAGLDAPGWVERKLAAIAQLRLASQAVVDELGNAVELEVFDVVAEA